MGEFQFIQFAQHTPSPRDRQAARLQDSEELPPPPSLAVRGIYCPHQFQRESSCEQTFGRLRWCVTRRGGGSTLKRRLKLAPKKEAA